MKLRLPLLLGGVCALSACGGEPVIGIATTVRFPSGLTRDEVDELALYVVGGVRSDDVVVPCTDLFGGGIQPDDRRLEKLANTRVALTANTTSITLDVASGEGRVVYVQAFDANDVLVGHGCKSDVTVLEDETTHVDIPMLDVD